MTRVDECRKRVLVAAFAYGQALRNDCPQLETLEDHVTAYKHATQAFRDAVRAER